jgi:hypothetical protein
VCPKSREREVERRTVEKCSAYETQKCKLRSVVRVGSSTGTVAMEGGEVLLRGLFSFMHTRLQHKRTSDS